MSFERNASNSIKVKQNICVVLPEDGHYIQQTWNGLGRVSVIVPDKTPVIAVAIINCVLSQAERYCWKYSDLFGEV